MDAEETKEAIRKAVEETRLDLPVAALSEEEPQKNGAITWKQLAIWIPIVLTLLGIFYVTIAREVRQDTCLEQQAKLIQEIQQSIQQLDSKTSVMSDSLIEIKMTLRRIEGDAIITGRPALWGTKN